MKKLLTINELKDLAGTLQMLGHTPLSSCKTYIINDEICVDKQELLDALTDNGGINVKCFTRTEVNKIFGNLITDFPPDYQFKNEELWTISRVKSRISEQLSLTGSAIDEHINAKLKSLCRIRKVTDPAHEFYNTWK